jgi:hypothetical protein
MKMKLSLNIAFILLVAVYLMPTNSFSQVPSNDAQIKSAVLGAPEGLRDGAKILGFDKDEKLITLRDGTNELICLADDPNSNGFNSACYHVDLEPFMARGRALREDGLSMKEIFDTRENEVQAGTLKMPESPTTLHIYYGSSDILNIETGEVTGGNYRAVVYIPYATAASTGLPLTPEVAGGPWLMDPGTHRAHIMITPPKKDN